MNLRCVASMSREMRRGLRQPAAALGLAACCERKRGGQVVSERASKLAGEKRPQAAALQKGYVCHVGHVSNVPISNTLKTVPTRLVEHVFNVLEALRTWHDGNMPHDGLRRLSESSLMK